MPKVDKLKRFRLQASNQILKTKIVELNADQMSCAQI